MINSPLEQFELISLLPITFLNFDFSITNLLIINIIVLILFIFVVYFLCLNTSDLNNKSFYLVPNSWQVFVETLYDVVSQLLFDNINLEGEKYFPYISMIFLYILFSNLIGLIPYSFTATSHIVVTFSLSFSIFIGVNIIGFQKHKLNMLSFKH